MKPLRARSDGIKNRTSKQLWSSSHVKPPLLLSTDEVEERINQSYYCISLNMSNWMHFSVNKEVWNAALGHLCASRFVRSGVITPDYLDSLREALLSCCHSLCCHGYIPRIRFGFFFQTMEDAVIASVSVFATLFSKSAPNLKLGPNASLDIKDADAFKVWGLRNPTLHHTYLKCKAESKPNLNYFINTGGTFDPHQWWQGLQS